MDCASELITRIVRRRFPKILARLLQLWDRATGMQSTVPPELAN